MPTPHERTPTCFKEIYLLDLGHEIDESGIHRLLDFINKRHDCSDFRMLPILRSLYAYSSLISNKTVQAMRDTVLNFKYWIDEPGIDSMCYWSENHQLLFAASEYLAGQLYPEDIFTNNKETGLWHMQKAKLRLEIWFDTRFRYGFVEWHSNTYYEEDIAALSILIDFAKDTEIVEDATTLLDLLLLDMALHSYKGLFAAASGRCYAKQKQDPSKQDVRDILGHAFGFKQASAYDYSKVSSDFLLNKKYKVPTVIRKIATDEETSLVLDSHGLSLKEALRVFPDKDDTLRHGLYLWSMEAFSNPESAEQTVNMWRKWQLQKNKFLSSIRYMDIPVIKHLGLLPLLVRILNPVTQGLAIQRANTYTYRTKHFMLSTAQQYHPGSFGDQQHIWQATVGKGVSVFTTHPGTSLDEDSVRNRTPNYWVGNGIHPHAQQHENVALVYYDLSPRRGLMEGKRQLFTHAWFPTEAFDEVILLGDYTYCARSDEGYIALLGTEKTILNAPSELIQYGKISCWAAILGSSEEMSFSAFIASVKASRFTRKKNLLSLTYQETEYILEYKSKFTVNGIVEEIDYPRLNSKYGTVMRNPDRYELSMDDETLILER